MNSLNGWGTRAVIVFGCLIAAKARGQPGTPVVSDRGVSDAPSSTTMPEPIDSTAGGTISLPRDGQARVPPSDLAITVEQGGALYSDNAGPSGVHWGATPLVRFGSLGVGLSVAANHTIIFKSASSSEYSFLLGLSSRSADGMRLDVLGSVGWHSYVGWGASEYGTDATFKGASEGVPCAGARVRLLYVFSRQRRVHFLLGGQAGWDFDLETRQGISYDNGGSQEVRSVGGQRWMLGLVLGMAFDVGGHKSPLKRRPSQ
jgi:hypothetical protein